jgi:hypothetical protein
MRVFLIANILLASLQIGCGLTVISERPPVSFGGASQSATEHKRDASEDTPIVALIRLLPDSDLIGGWRMLGTPALYDEDNLFEYIDGKAEEYRSYDFYMLVSAQYVHTRQPEIDRSEDESVTVDIYDMTADTNAFGIYSTQRYPEADYVEIGSQGFLTQASLEFWKGRYFIKISTVTPTVALKDIMIQLGQHISSKISGDSKPPAILSYLPEKGYVDNSAVFAFRDILGQSFLRNGIIAEYIIDETPSRLFLAQYPSSEEALEAFSSFSKFLGDSGGEIETLSDTGEKAFVTDVSFYGRVVVFFQGVFVGGILNAPDGSSTMDLLQDLISNLRKAA